MRSPGRTSGDVDDEGDAATLQISDRAVEVVDRQADMLDAPVRRRGRRAGFRCMLDKEGEPTEVEDDAGHGGAAVTGELAGAEGLHVETGGRHRVLTAKMEVFEAESHAVLTLCRDSSQASSPCCVRDLARSRRMPQRLQG